MTTLAPPTLPPAKLTVAEFLRLSDSIHGEYVRGQLVEKNVSILSSETEAVILSSLSQFLKHSPVARVFPASLNYRCFPDDPDQFRRPDVSLITVERLKLLPSGDSGYMTIPPDLAVEVISTNDLVYELDDKIQEYLHAGFPLLWIVDPRARTVIVHATKQKPVILTEADTITAEPLLPGFSARVAEFFPPSL